jgi:alpha-tubulin suppressor-like RCC1 family protein
VSVSNILSNVVQVSAGWKHAVALTSDGKVWAWGNNAEGAIGNGVTSTAGVTTPFQVPGLSNVIGVSAGDRFTGILKADGTVWTWGAMNDSTQYGQLGVGTFVGATSPVKVTGGLTNVILYAARDYHDLAVKSDGSVWAWGSGDQGELGNCKFVHSPVPVRVLFPSPDSPSIISPLIVTGSIGLPFTYSIDVTGTQPITLDVAGLPDWSALNGSIISGTPNITATSIVTITANSSFGCDMQLLTIHIVRFNVYLPPVLK